MSVLCGFFKKSIAIMGLKNEFEKLEEKIRRINKIRRRSKRHFDRLSRNQIESVSKNSKEFFDTQWQNHLTRWRETSWYKWVFCGAIALFLITPLAAQNTHLESDDRGKARFFVSQFVVNHPETASFKTIDVREDDVYIEVVSQNAFGVPQRLTYEIPRYSKLPGWYDLQAAYLMGQ